MKSHESKQNEPIEAPIDMLTIHASAESVSQYKHLLTADWSRELSNQVLALLGNVAGDWLVGNETLAPLLDPKQTDSFPTDSFHSILTRIRQGTRFLRGISLPDLPERYVPTKKLPVLAWQANRLAVWLTLQAHGTLKGDTDFLADLQALAFQAALHFTLPALKDKDSVEHGLLLHAAALFTLGYAPHDPAHESYMMSMIHDYLGNEDQRLTCLFAAFRLTPPQDHSYLTRAQAYWSELLDANRYKEAEQFLFSLPWWSMPSQQEEVREMIVDAFKHTLKASHNHK